MKNCILINSFTNTKYKLDLLYKQIENVKQTNYPIILCSGCTVPNDIIDKVDHFILNKEKIIRPASFQKECWKNNLSYVSSYYFLLSNTQVILFNDTVDLTVSKNTKLLFNTAKYFGFENAVYLDYDNLFIDTSKYLNDHFEILEKDEYKACFVNEMIDPPNITSNIFYMTHFFSNINFFIEHFKYPTNLVELNDEHILKEINPWQMYEMSTYKCFTNFYDKIYHIDKNYYNENIQNQNLYNRHDNISFIVNQFTKFVKNLKTNEVYGLFYNPSTKNDFTVKVNVGYDTHVDSQFFNKIHTNFFYFTEKLNVGNSVEVVLKNLDGEIYTKKIIYENEDSILGYC
jgi:hypothetical protein